MNPDTSPPRLSLGRRFLPLVIFLLIVGGAIALFLPLSGRDRVGPGLLPGRDTPPTGEISIAFPEEPATFNPYTIEGDSNATRDLLRPILPTLLSITPDLKYVPSLAAEAPATSDAGGIFTITTELNSKAKWSDGLPITSEDVKFTWETIRNSDPALRRRSAYQRIVDVQTPSPNVVTLVFDSPFPLWRNLFSAGDFILPKHALEGRNFRDEWRERVPISGGPFTMVSVTPGLEVVYEANPMWWGRGPGLQRVRVVYVQNLDVAVELLKQGRLHAIFSTTEPNLSGRLDLDGVSLSSNFGASWWELGFNTSRKTMGNRSHRVAIAVAIDRASIVEALVREEGKSLERLPSAQNLGNPFSSYEFDQERSRAERGGTDLGRLVLSGPSDSTMASAMGVAIQAGLKNARITIELQNPEAKRFYGEWLRDGNYDVALWERRGTPIDSWRDRFHSAEIPPAGLNYSRIAAPELDALLAMTERTAALDETSRADALAKIAELIPVLPMFEAKAYLAFMSGLGGPDSNATIDGPLWNLEQWRLR